MLPKPAFAALSVSVIWEVVFCCSSPQLGLQCACFSHFILCVDIFQIFFSLPMSQQSFWKFIQRFYFLKKKKLKWRSTCIELLKLCWVLELHSACREGRVLSVDAPYRSLCCFPVIIIFSDELKPCSGTCSVLVGCFK